MTRFGHLAQRLFNTPLAIHPQKAEIIIGALADRLGIIQATRINGDALALSPGEADGEGATYSEAGYEVELGIAKIDVAGTLVQKLGSLRPYSGMTGYDGIRENLFEALNDSRVKGIMLDIDSPGGEVAGCFDLVDTIYQARDVKPIWAILNESAYSAGYAIASAAEFISVPRTGGVGSVGVIWMHCDFSTALKDAGIKVTFVYRGDRKTDAWPELPLSEEAFKRAQADINTMGGIFENTVARNRGLSADKIRDMQAATFLGAEGVSVGLADAVMAPDAAFRAFLERLG